MSPWKPFRFQLRLKFSNIGVSENAGRSVARTENAINQLYLDTKRQMAGQYEVFRAKLSFDMAQ
jgi:hypothetical protein